MTTVHLSNRVLQHLCQLLERDVPAIVAVPIVKELEVVGVDHQEGKWGIVADRSLYLLLDSVSEVAIVVELGKVVEDNRVLDFL